MRDPLACVGYRHRRGTRNGTWHQRLRRLRVLAAKSSNHVEERDAIVGVRSGFDLLLLNSSMDEAACWFPDGPCGEFPCFAEEACYTRGEQGWLNLAKWARA